MDDTLYWFLWELLEVFFCFYIRIHGYNVSYLRVRTTLEDSGHETGTPFFCGLLEAKEEMTKKK